MYLYYLYTVWGICVQYKTIHGVSEVASGRGTGMIASSRSFCTHRGGGGWSN